MTLPKIKDDDLEMDDATEPAWMEKFRSPESLGRAVRAAEVSSEEEENEEADAELTRPVLRESIGGVKEDDGGAGTSGRRRGNAVEDPFDAPVVEKTQTKTKSGDSPRKPSAPPPKPDGSSTRVDLVATSNLGGKSKVLFEIEGAGEAVDLDGDTGAVGRWLAESARSLKVDMKGVMYNARVAPCAGTVVVVAVNADQAKIESVHREYVQLREDPNAMGGMQNLGVGSLFDDQDDDGADAGADAFNPENTTTAGSKRKRAAGTGASSAKSRAKPRGKPRAGGTGAKSRTKRSKK